MSPEGNNKLALIGAGVFILAIIGAQITYIVRHGVHGRLWQPRGSRAKR